MYRAEGHVGSLVPCLFPDLLACLVESGFAHAYGKLFATLLTLEDQLLSILVSRLVEYYIIVTFRASYSFHISLLFVVGGGGVSVCVVIVAFVCLSSAACSYTDIGGHLIEMTLPKAGALGLKSV